MVGGAVGPTVDILTATVAFGALRHTAIAGRHRQRGLAPAQAQRDHPIVTAAGSHPDCRAVLIQIVALYTGIPLRFSRHFCLRLSRGNRRRCQTLRHSTPKTSVSTACAKQHSHAVTHNVGHRSALRVRDAVAFSTTQGIAHTKFFLPLNCCRVGGDDR